MMTLEKFFTEKGIEKDSTKKHYKASVKQYEKVNEKNLSLLLEEADKEEEQGIRWKNRTLKQRLIDFRNYLYLNKSEGTAKQYLTDIKAVYRHFEIELQPLPSFNSKAIQKTYEPSFEDLPTREELIDAYYEATNTVKCIILFAMSSGYSKVDLLNLTVGDFINACSEYITGDDDLIKQLEELKNQPVVIPTFVDERQKTIKKFTTFCSPEASEHIIQYLLGRDAEIREKHEADEKLPEKLMVEDKLFKISKSQLTYVFRKINNKLGMGHAGKFTRLRCHMLRKFHASTLLNSEMLTWTVEEIDTLQGRSQDKTHRAYFHNDRKKLWQKYYECVDELMLFKSIHEVDKEAYENLEKENRFYKNEISKNEKKMEEQERILSEILKKQELLEQMVNL